MNADLAGPPVLLVTHVTAIDVGAIPALLSNLGRSSRVIRANKGEPFPENVEALGGVLDVLQRVLVEQRQARVVECPLVVVRQVLAAHADHKLVEVHHDDALD